MTLPWLLTYTEFQGDLCSTLRMRAFGGLQHDVSRWYQNRLTWIIAAENREGRERVCAHQPEPRTAGTFLEGRVDFQEKAHPSSGF